MTRVQSNCTIVNKNKAVKKAHIPLFQEKNTVVLRIGRSSW